ncbi:thiamine pyrophosphokinase [Pavlovales sp. CCMP2436]|nr:thiamine pyrophosphokinase [Pavlovales sp. CCMP2436]|mmetsp:Transcript_27391/g.64174  ORF Transcript_27391/g.64174 Transcript_27391/m.64174 type:complete len:278 (+) Transcript_27391:109-942(+)
MFGPSAAGVARGARAVHSNGFLSSRGQLQHVALVFLNSDGVRCPPLPSSSGSAGEPSVFERVWRCARYRVCADGAANRLFDGLCTDARRTAYTPDLIKGDLDSIRKDVRTFYAGRGVQVVCDGDQDHHDLDKCLMSLQDLQAQWVADGGEEMTVVVLGAFGGRLDQEMANLNMLFRWQSFGKLLFMSDDSTAMLLPPGEHEIHPNLEVESTTCGLVPLGGPCAQVRTSGLRWDLHGEPLAFGGMVSTSNEIVGSTVTVQTDGPLIWTTVLRGSTALR